MISLWKNLHKKLNFLIRKYFVFAAISFPFLADVIVFIATDSYRMVAPFLKGTALIDSHYVLVLPHLILAFSAILFFSTVDKKRIVAALYILIFHIPSLLNFIHYLLLDSALDVSSVGIVLNSNVVESIDFIRERINVKIISACIFYVIFAAGLLRAKYRRFSFSGLKKYRLISISLLPIVMFFEDSTIKTIGEAINLQLAELKEISENSVHIKLNNIVSKISERKQTYVIVIGESVDRKHMSIYGYEKKTTPYFDNLKDELYVFKNVRSAFANTTDSVKSALRIRDEKCKNIINFLKDAGFKVFWFSNQGSTHFFENQIEKIAKLTHNYKTVCTDTKNFSNTFDEKLLDCLKEALSDETADKKVIFLHLIGSHVPLTKRYPKEFDVFKIPNSYNYKWKATAVRVFDNSILYTDYVLKRAIEMLRQQRDCACLLYFSDHGQDIYDTAESKIFREISGESPNMYEIPLIVWVSEKYKNSNEKFISNWDLKKKYVIDKLSYSIADLIRLDHPIITKKDSIFCD